MKFGPAEPMHAREYYLRHVTNIAVKKALQGSREHAVSLAFLLVEMGNGCSKAIEDGDREALKKWAERAAEYGIRLACAANNVLPIPTDKESR